MRALQKSLFANPEQWPAVELSDWTTHRAALLRCETPGECFGRSDEQAENFILRGPLRYAALKHDPEKWASGFPKGSCSN
jgi:hypothetical protein